MQADADTLSADADESALLTAVRQLKLEHPEVTAKQAHALLLESGSTQYQVAQVKRACSKAAKLLAKEPPPAEPACEIVPPACELVPPPMGSVTFVRCQACEARVKRPRVCAGCCAVCYCSPACAASDREHHAECASIARHMLRDVSITLPGDEPPWLVATGMSPTAGPRHSDVDWCDLLEAAGVHDDIYCVLCGCVSPSSPHRYVPNPLAGLVDYPAGGEHSDASPPPPPVVRSWAEYYAWRGLPPDAPVALLLTWPLTVYHCLVRLGLSTITDRPLVVHYLGPEKEVRAERSAPSAAVCAAKHLAASERAAANPRIAPAPCAKLRLRCRLPH